MANTADLLGLITEFSSAFADPEFPVDNSAQPPREAADGPAKEEPIEWDEKTIDSDISDHDSCHFYLWQFEDDLELRAIAETFLSELAKIATLKKQLRNMPSPSSRQEDETSETLDKISEIIDFGLHLPETHARQGTPECPGGLCSL